VNTGQAKTRTTPLLQLRNLSVDFSRRRHWVHVVEDVSLEVMSGEIFALVGESGCGKSTIASSIMRLMPVNSRYRQSGSVGFSGRELMSLDAREMRAVRGAQIAMIPQDPSGSLNPLFTVGNQVAEAIRAHGAAAGQDLREAVIERLRSVRIDQPEKRIDQYPHELSGGMRQRVVGAIATACKPRLLIADEPTTALDVTVQARFLDMLKDLQESTGLAILFITHDMGVVARLCDRMAVMYAGRIVESGPVEAVFGQPAHWYTRALLDCAPSMEHTENTLHSIPGAPPRPGSITAGCRFAPRCPAVQEKCTASEPRLEGIAPGQAVRCWYPRTGSA